MWCCDGLAVIGGLDRQPCEVRAAGVFGAVGRKSLCKKHCHLKECKGQKKFDLIAGRQLRAMCCLRGAGWVVNLDCPVGGEAGEGPGPRGKKKKYINCVMELVGVFSCLWGARHCNRE